MIDPITLEVVRHRLDTIAEEMEITLLKSAYSSIVKEGLDASTAIFDIRGQTIAQGTSIPIHLGSLIPAVNSILTTFPPSQMQEGDVYLLNDPYNGGTHLPDITIVVPVMYEGKALALGCTIAHHQDMGGKTPGSVPPNATELYQEGLILPPLKLYEAGKPNEALHAIIRSNVRIPDTVMGDMRAQMAAGNVASARLTALFNEYGKKTVLECMKELLDRSEAMTRRELEQIPDGTYAFADFMDNDGIDMDKRIKIQVQVTIKGSDLIVDFAGTSPQVRGPFNSVPSSTLSAVYYILRAITDPTIPNNAGCFRPITAKLPGGSIVNPNPPAPVCSRTATVKRIADVLNGALVQAAPERLLASSSGQLLVLALGGMDPLTSTPYVTSELGAGGMGARPSKDGIDSIETDVTNCMNIPAEAIEMSYPIRIRKWRLWDGSGGAGHHRGGLGVEKIFEVTRGQATVTYRGERHTTPPWGLLGGLPAWQSRAHVVRKSGGVEEVASKEILTLNEGDQLHTFTAGGAGYGDPLSRDPRLVLGDLLDKKTLLESVSQDYGVVLKEGSIAVDHEATEGLRRRLREERGPINWTYDRGTELGKE
ncbi:MAG: hydantoinase B/oxoprolinase family protein [Dehalococcoidia bacterium]